MVANIRATIEYDPYFADRCVEERNGDDDLLRQYSWGNYIDALLQQREYHTDDGSKKADYYPLWLGDQVSVAGFKGPNVRPIAHTHPGGSLTLSKQDIATLATMYGRIPRSHVIINEFGYKRIDVRRAIELNASLNLEVTPEYLARIIRGDFQ